MKIASSENLSMDAVREQVNALIRNRRTIKPGEMSDQAVSEDDLMQILENANWAPTHGLTEPWRFKVFRGDARARLAVALSDIYKTVTPPDRFIESKFVKLQTVPLKAPVCIVVCMERQDSGKIPEVEEIEAVACAVQNMHLTASAIGMAAFWSSPTVLYSPEVNDWLGLREQDRCLGLFYLGWPRAGNDWPSSQRRPIREKIEWVDR